jgi:hypothetical protein
MVPDGSDIIIAPAGAIVGAGIAVGAPPGGAFVAASIDWDSLGASCWEAICWGAAGSGAAVGGAELPQATRMARVRKSKAIAPLFVVTAPWRNMNLPPEQLWRAAYSQNTEGNTRARRRASEADISD